MSIKRTIITTVVVLALVAVVVPVSSALALTAGCSLSNTSTCNAADLGVLVGQLQGTLTQLQTAGTGGTGACTGITFTRNLVVGSTGSDVKCLQQILNQSAQTQVSVTGAGSPGNETSYFGPKTLVAVKKYQVVQGFTPANQVGPLTRAKLNAALGTGTTLPAGCTSTSGFSSTTGASCSTGTVTTLPAGCTSTSGFSPTTGASCSTGVVTPAQTGPISAQLASDNPASGAIVSNQAQADLLHVNFTGSGTVTSLTLQRSGISDQSTLTSVYLFDGATRITSGNSFNTNGTLTFNGLSIAVSGSHTISVKADVVAGATVTPYNASTIAVAMTGYTANGTTSNASVNGNLMSIVAGNLATSKFNTTSATTSPAATTINAGAMNQTLWSRTVSIGTRAVELHGLTVKMIGSAPSNTLANVGLYVDGTLAKTATINSMNQFVFDANSAPVTLSTGAHLLEVRGDVIGGSYRNFYLSLEQGSDVSIRDPQLGVYVTTTDSASATAYNFNGGQVSIASGSLTVSQEVAFNNTTTLVGGASSVKMASFTFTSYGENTKVMSLTFTPTITGGATFANVGLYVNGGQVGSSGTATSGSAITFPNLGSNLVVPVGSPVTVAIYGDTITSGGAAYTTGTETFHLDSGTAQGVTSSQSVTVGAQGGQALSISNANVSFAATTGFAVAAAAPNSTGVKIGSFTLQTGSAEGVTVNNIALTFPAGATNTLINGLQLNNLKVMVGSTQIGTPIGSPVITTANNFSSNTVVPISSTTVFDVYADLGSSASGLTVTPWMNVTYRGSTSNVSNSTGATAGTQTTAGAAVINAAGVTFVPGSSLTAQYVTGNGSTSLPIATFNVVSNNHVGGAVIKNVTFTVASTNTISTITMNGQTGSVSGTTATLYNVGITVPADNSGVNIPVTAVLVPVGSGSSGAASAPVSVEITTLTYNDGTTVQTIYPTATSASLELASTVPTVTMTSGTVTGLQNGQVQSIGSFTVGAGSTGAIKLQAIPIFTAISGGVTALDTITLRDSSGTALYGTNTCSAVGTCTFTFSTPRTLNANGSETYTVYGKATVVTPGNAGSSGESVALGDKSLFLWTDVAGSQPGLTGTNIYGYPTNSQSRTN